MPNISPDNAPNTDVSRPALRGRRSRSGSVCHNLAAAAFAACVLAGCQEPVLTPDEPRSQYDRFDTVRDQRAPSYVTDEFGNRKPNIRSRLLAGE